MSTAAKKIMMGSGAVAEPSDDQFNRVSFLSHFNGANNGVNNAFDDSSSSNHTITANGNVTQGSFGPFARPDGEWGVSFDGSGDRLRTNSSNLDITTEAFTAEAWIFPVSSMDQYDIIVCMFASSHGSNANQTWSIRAGANNTIEIVTISSGTQTTQSAGTANIGAWNHVAISRNGTTMYAALNGAVTSKSCASSLNGHEYFYIGAADANGSGAYFFNGVISNVRYEIGNARYTLNYTVPTSKLTTTTNTKILTCQSNRFVDNSTLNNTFLISGNPAVSAFGPFLTSSVYDPAVNGASMECDGSGDYLSLAYDADFNFGTGSFTIEAFVFFKDLSGVQGIYATNTGANPVPKWVMYLDGATPKVHINALNGSGSISMNATTNLTANSWNHLAYVRNGSTWYWFINGTQAGTGSNSTNITFSNVATTIGYGGESYFTGFNGFISDLRVVKGTAVYTSNFTPPTAPVTAITNTKLLLNMADGQVFDSAAQNNLTLYGTAKTSTAQKKFGTASLLLDGNSDYATFTENGGNDIDGGGNWTVEFFWRFVNKTSPSIQEIISKGAGFQLYTINGSLGFALSANNSGTYFINSTGGTTLDNDTFYHIALVKNGTSYKLYLNGTSDLSATSSSNIDTGGYPWFLGTISGAESTYPSNGYMDEVRISKFARYTSNFTAPTEPFADKGQDA